MQNKGAIMLKLKQKPTKLVALFILMSLCVPLLANGASGKRPNIIFLFADDQRADTIGAHGNPHIKTPNLDRLSEAGFSFRNNYCAGSFSGAVCVASRAMLMTGRHWMMIKDRKAWKGMATFPELLAKDGYTTFAVGKWHNGSKTLARSFQSGKSVFTGGMADHTKVPLCDLTTDGTLVNKRIGKEFSSTEFATAAIDFLESPQGKKPFFLYVAFTAPHDPRNPPEAYRKMYYNHRPPLPENYLPVHPFWNAPQVTGGRDEGLAPWPRTKEIIRDQLCDYYGLITQLDEQVGRIMTALEKSPYADNTIVIYTADHGLAMGSHGLLGKQNVYEQSMSSPLIIKGPGIPVNQSSTAFTYVHDLYATVCAFTGTAPPEEIDAKDLSPIMQDKMAAVHDSVFLPFLKNQLAVNDGRWKLHVYPQINHRLLFDLKNDPHEIHNLAENPEYRTQAERMAGLMKSWQQRLGDATPLRSTKPKPKEVQFDNSKRVLDTWQPQWIREKYFDGRTDVTHGKKRK